MLEQSTEYLTVQMERVALAEYQAQCRGLIKFSYYFISCKMINLTIVLLFYIYI